MTKEGLNYVLPKFQIDLVHASIAAIMGDKSGD